MSKDQMVHVQSRNIAQLITKTPWQKFHGSIPKWVNLFLRIDDSHCDKIYSFLTANHYFDDGYVAKQPLAWKEYFVKYW